MRVLVIEPDKRLADNCKIALNNAGYKSVLAKTAQEAVHEIDKLKPDVIITELQIKQHNGVELLYELRSYPDWQDIPVIILTFVPPEKFSTDEAILNNMGVTEYMYKPTVRLEQIVRAVRRATEHVLA